MAILYAIMFGLPFAMTVPAYVISMGSLKSDSWMLLFVHVPAALFWLWLINHHYGAQSLGNLAEGILMPAAVASVGIIKALFFNRHLKRPARWTYALVLVSLALTFLVRTFMPLIPE